MMNRAGRKEYRTTGKDSLKVALRHCQDLESRSSPREMVRVYSLLKAHSGRQDSHLSESILFISSEGCQIIHLRNTEKWKTTIPSVPCGLFNYVKHVSLYYKED